jgi:hypothetical protein
MKLLLILSLCTLCQSAFSASGRIYGTRLGEVGGRYGFPVPPRSPPVEPPKYLIKAPPAPAWQLRIVEGQLYNIVHSARWARLIPQAPMSVGQVLPDGVVFTMPEQVVRELVGESSLSRRVYRPSRYELEIDQAYRTSVMTRTDVLPAGRCFVRNFPGGELLTVGERISPQNLLVMRVMPFQFGDQTIPAYDYGVEFSEETKALVKNPAPVKATNAVAIK